VPSVAMFTSVFYTGGHAGCYVGGISKVKVKVKGKVVPVLN